jgi:cytokinesis protein
MLINGILARAADLKTRISLRTNMELAGVQQIIDFAQDMGQDNLRTNLNQFVASAEDDQAELKDQLGREVLNNLSDPQEIFQTIIGTLSESPAQAYFLSSLKHLLLIPNEDVITQTKYYQVIDGLVTDIILERRASYAHEFGDPAAISFQKLAANFNEQERAEKAEAESSDLRGQLVRLKYEKEKLDEELAKGSDGLVGDLKAKVAMLEEKLRTSRENSDALQGRLVEQRRGYEERILQLEMQILELFNMLKQDKKDEDLTVYDGTANGERRKELITTLTKQHERTKARSILEGERRKRKDGKKGVLDEDTESSDDFAVDHAVGSTGRAGTSVRRKKQRVNANGVPSMGANGHTSQFLDAEDEYVDDNYVVDPVCLVDLTSLKVPLISP